MLFLTGLVQFLFSGGYAFFLLLFVEQLKPVDGQVFRGRIQGGRADNTSYICSLLFLG